MIHAVKCHVNLVDRRLWSWLVSLVSKNVTRKTENTKKLVEKIP